MRKEEFISLGIDEKLAEKAAEESKKELSNYVPKARFNEVNDSKKQLETTVNDYKNQLDYLKASAGDNEALREQITQLQAQNQKKDEEYQEKLKDMQLTNAIKLSIGAVAQDSDLVAGLIDKTKLILGDDGKVTGLDEQLKSLKETKAFLFKQEEKPIGNKGFFPLGPKGSEAGGQEGRMTMKEASAAKLNMNQEGKGE